MRILCLMLALSLMGCMTSPRTYHLKKEMQFILDDGTVVTKYVGPSENIYTYKSTTDIKIEPK